jgi:hypothetical protein
LEHYCFGMTLNEICGASVSEHVGLCVTWILTNDQFIDLLKINYIAKIEFYDVLSSLLWYIYIIDL